MSMMKPIIIVALFGVLISIVEGGNQQQQLVASHMKAVAAQAQYHYNLSTNHEEELTDNQQQQQLVSSHMKAVAAQYHYNLSTIHKEELTDEAKHRAMSEAFDLIMERSTADEIQRVKDAAHNLTREGGLFHVAEDTTSSSSSSSVGQQKKKYMFIQSKEEQYTYKDERITHTYCNY